MKSGLRLLGAVALLGWTAACATVRTNDTAADPTAYLRKAYDTLHREVLDNGMIALIAEDRSAPAVSIQIWVGAGSIHEENHLGAGLSHAIEHMIFKGTPTRDVGAITRDINEAGGDINAYTGFDRTVFHADLPASEWKTGLDVLADAVMNAHVPEDEWGKERNVILREIDMHADNPDRALSQILWSTAYRVHPYRFPVIGHKPVFSSIAPADLRDFFARHYTPDNMIVVVAGAVDRREALTALREAFANFPRVSRAPVFIPDEPPQLAPRYARRTGAYESTRLVMAWHTVPLTHPDTAALDVLANIVGRGRSSRLGADIQEQRRLVHSIGAWSYTAQHPGLFGISARFDPAREQDVLAAIEENIAQWSVKPFTDEDIEKARRQLVRSELASLRTMSGLARHVAAGEFYAGSPRFSETYIRQIDAVTPQDLRAVAQRYLRPENRTVAVLAPAQPETEPDARPAEPITPGPAQTYTLSNGVRLIVYEDRRLPFVHFCAALGGGLLSETEADNGVARLMSRLLTRGTRKRSAETIAETVEARGGSISPFSGRNSFGLQAECMAEDVGLFFDLLADSLLRPQFPDKEIDKEKTLQLAAIAARQERPFHLAQAELDKLLYPGHPYRFDALGTAESVKDISRDSIENHFQTHAVSGNMVLALFGHIDPEKAKALAEQHFAAMPQGSAPEQRMRAIEHNLPARTKQRRPREQTILMAGFPGVSLHDPRQDALDLLAQALSGLSSSLGMEIREKRGLAYYAGAYQHAGLDSGSFVFYVGTREDALDPVETLILEEIQRLIDEGLDEKEFERTRRRMVARHQRNLQRLDNMAMQCALNELYGIGIDRFFGMPERLAALTREDVRQAAASILNADAMAVSILMPDTTQ